MASATASPVASPKIATAPSTTPSFMRPTAASQARTQHSASPKSPVRSAMPKPSRNSISTSKRLASNSSAKRPSIMTGRVAPKATNETSTVLQPPLLSQGISDTRQTVCEKHPVTINGGATATPPSAPTQVANDLSATTEHHQDNSVNNPALTVANDHGAAAEPTKRKRDEEDESSEIMLPVTDNKKSKRISEDCEPAEKKRKAIQKKIPATRQYARRDTGVEDSDDEVIVVPQRKRKVAEKTSTPKKPILDDFDRGAMREAERFRRDAQKGKLAKGKFLRSFNDTIAGSYARRDYVTSKPTVAANPVPNLRPVTSQSPKVAPHKMTTAKKPVVEKKKAESTPIVIDEKDPNVRIVDLSVIKSLRTGADGMTTASLENIMKAPELYPNVEITCNDAGKPIQARVVTMGPDEWTEMLKVSKARARQQRTQAIKQARKVALENGDFFKTTRVTKRKGARRLAPNLKKP